MSLDPAEPRRPRSALRRALELRIVELATSQHGVVTRAQVLDAGMSASALRRRVRDERLVILHRGVYGVGPFLPVRARSMAAVLACGPGAVLSHRSAADIWGLLPCDDSASPIHVTLPPGVDRAHAGIVVHRADTLLARETAVRDGLAVTSPLRTLVDLAPIVDSRDLERAIACAERERLVSRDEIASLGVDYRGRRSIRRLRAIVERAGGPALTRSEAERRFLSLVRRARLPTPRANVRVDEYEIDFFWPDHDLAVEVDGYRYHGSRVRFESDRQRASRLAALGIQVVPLTWRQIVTDELATAVQLGQALARARRSSGPNATVGARAGVE